MNTSNVDSFPCTSALQYIHHMKVMCHWTPARRLAIVSFVPRGVRYSCKLAQLLQPTGSWVRPARIMVLLYRWQNWSPGSWIRSLLCVRHYWSEWMKSWVFLPSILVLSPCSRATKGSFAWKCWTSGGKEAGFHWTMFKMFINWFVLNRTSINISKPLSYPLRTCRDPLSLTVRKLLLSHGSHLHFWSSWLVLDMRLVQQCHSKVGFSLSFSVRRATQFQSWWDAWRTPQQALLLHLRKMKPRKAIVYTPKATQLILTKHKQEKSRWRACRW